MPGKLEGRGPCRFCWGLALNWDALHLLPILLLKIVPRNPPASPPVLTRLLFSFYTSQQKQKIRLLTLTLQKGSAIIDLLSEKETEKSG